MTPKLYRRVIKLLRRVAWMHPFKGDRGREAAWLALLLEQLTPGEGEA